MNVLVSSPVAFVIFVHKYIGVDCPGGTDAFITALSVSNSVAVVWSFWLLTFIVAHDGLAEVKLHEKFRFVLPVFSIVIIGILDDASCPLGSSKVWVFDDAVKFICVSVPANVTVNAVSEGMLHNTVHRKGLLLS